MKLWLPLARVGARIWSDWPDSAYKHQHYRDRLKTVQDHLSECLDNAHEGPLRIISICAGDGRDIIDVLHSHHRRNDVTAWLVELNAYSVDAGQRRATAAGLAGIVNFLHCDATTFAAYKEIYPADIVLLCGVWGHVPATDRQMFAGALAALCRPGAMVVWTRGVAGDFRRFADIDAVFTGPSWQKVRVSFTSSRKWAIVTNRYVGPTGKVPDDGRLFHFRRCAGT